MPTPIHSVGLTAQPIRSELIRRERPAIPNLLKEQQQIQLALQSNLHTQSALSWLRLGLGKLGGAVADALGYVFGPLFWYAFEANLKQAAKDYDEQREQAMNQAQSQPKDTF